MLHSKISSDRLLAHWLVFSAEKAEPCKSGRGWTLVHVHVQAGANDRSMEKLGYRHKDIPETSEDIDHTPQYLPAALLLHQYACVHLRLLPQSQLPW